MISRLNIVLCLVAMMVLSSFGNAQLLKSIGAKIAYTSAFQDFDYTNFEVDRERRNGINAALFAEWFNGEPISVITQVEYAQRGMGMRIILTSPSDPEGGVPTIFYGRVDYLSFPFLAKLYILSDQIKPYLLGGFRLDFLLKYASDRDIFNSTYEKFSKSIYGISFGAGVAFDNFPVIVEARYNVDLKYSYRTELLKVNNNSIDIWLGIAFQP